MPEPELVYIVGPLTMGGKLQPGDPRLEENIHVAETVAAALVALGFAPVFTHSWARVALAHRIPVPALITATIQVARSAQRVALLDGWEESSGSRAEVADFLARNGALRGVSPRGGVVWTLSDAEKVLEDLKPLADESSWRDVSACLREFRRADLLDGLLSVGRVLAHGREKHGAESAHWKGQDVGEHWEHAEAHLTAATTAWLNVESVAEESGEAHAVHAAVRCLMLAEVAGKGIAP